MNEPSPQQWRDALEQHADIQTKFVELMVQQKANGEQLEQLVVRLDRLLETVDGYPKATAEQLTELHAKVAGEDGLRVQMKSQHAELKTLVRNWQLFATAALTFLAMVLKAMEAG